MSTQFEWKDKFPGTPIITIDNYSLDTMHSVYKEPNWFWKLLGHDKDFIGWNFSVEIDLNGPTNYFHVGDVIAIGVNIDLSTKWYIQRAIVNKPNTFVVNSVQAINKVRPVAPRFNVYKLYSTILL